MYECLDSRRREIMSITELLLTFKAKVVLLHDFRNCFCVYGKQTWVVNLLTASKNVVGYWKSSQIPSIKEWVMKPRHIPLIKKLSPSSMCHREIYPLLFIFKDNKHILYIFFE